jgi:hypothetical protein
MIELSDTAKQRQKALARWDNEGGAGPDGPQRRETSFAIIEDLPTPTDAELVQLHTRVIALENIVIALLADATDGQRIIARDLADQISPRPASTQHPLTLHAARHMLSMVERAEHIGTMETACHQVSCTPS